MKVVKKILSATLLLGLLLLFSQQVAFAEDEPVVVGGEDAATEDIMNEDILEYPKSSFYVEPPAESNPKMNIIEADDIDKNFGQTYDDRNTDDSEESNFEGIVTAPEE